MYFSHRNFNLKFNNQNLLVNNADITVGASLVNSYKMGDRSNFDYRPSDGINGSLKFSYYLTGQDPIKNYIKNETEIINVNFGGLYFNSGYLKSYSLNAVPNNPITVNSEIVFFEDIKGNFTEITPLDFNSNTPLNFSDMRIDNLTGYSAFTFSNLLSLSFNYNNEIKPIYFINSGTGLINLSPDYVNFGEKSINCEVSFDNLTGDLTIDGQNAGIKINFNNPQNSTLESLTVSGTYFQKNINSNVNQFVKNTISIRQENIYEPPILSSFLPPSPILPGNPVYLFGSNLSNVYDVRFNGERDNSFQIINDGLIISTMPLNALTGQIYLKGFGGETYSPTNYNLTYFPISVTGVSPITGKAGNKIFIYGDNFYKISSVNFSGKATGEFQKINSKTLIVKIPDTGRWSKISVISSGRNLTGLSTERFVIFPTISTMNPNSGISGTRVDVTGYNLDTITGVYIGNIQTTGFTINSTSGLTFYGTSGNILEYVKFFGQSGVWTQSESKFQPVVKLLGIDPQSGSAGLRMRITGQYIFDYLLHSGITVSGVMINFNGGYTGFYLDSSNSGISAPNFTGVLTGIIPENAISGKIYLVQSDGVTSYPSDFSFNKSYSAPLITNLTPNYATSGQLYSFSLVGKNLVNITLVRLSGISLTNRNSSISVGSNNLYSDLLGLKLNVLNVDLNNVLGIYTGLHSVLVSGNYGFTYSNTRVHLITGF